MVKALFIGSMHPTHSVTAMESRAKTYVQRDSDVYTPCPRNGCFGGLYDENAQLLFLGATLKTNTFIYSIEEWLNIPDCINPQSKKIKLLFEDDDVKEIDFYGHYSTRGDDSIGEYIFMSCSLVKLNREVFQTGLVGLILYFYTITFSLEQIISINLFSDRLIHLSFRKISCL